ncbi:hypothetical protein AMTR_s00038p00206590 [Amborella trichopoda]|uniref:Pectinesterase n=1 Tax=Amborella trichopoda TaxID=13333 RepID=U5D2T1_AMBTC|nr:hypothetical protein AMTR_s00038p00206590 [Amborella trichopoda]
MYPQPKFFLLLSLLSLSLKSIECDEPVPTIDYNTALLLKVDHAGQGDFINVQDAINAVPCNNSNLVFILISPGQYRQVLNHVIFFHSILSNAFVGEHHSILSNPFVGEHHSILSNAFVGEHHFV